MRIIRFLDENGDICFGQRLADQTVTLLEGDPWNTFRETQQPANVENLARIGDWQFLCPALCRILRIPTCCQLTYPATRSIMSANWRW